MRFTDVVRTLVEEELRTLVGKEVRTLVEEEVGWPTLEVDTFPVLQRSPVGFVVGIGVPLHRSWTQ